MTNAGDYTTKSFRESMRVELHPATDLWMRGARFGSVTKVERTKVHVWVDALHRVVAMDPRNLIPR